MAKSYFTHLRRQTAPPLRSYEYYRKKYQYRSKITVQWADIPNPIKARLIAEKEARCQIT